MNEKKFFIVIAAAFTFTTLLFAVVQSYRLERSMAAAERYRAELEAASDRQQSIRELVEGTGAVFSETVYTVGELRKKLEEVERSYNSLLQLVSGNDSNSDSEEIDAKKRN